MNIVLDYFNTLSPKYPDQEQKLVPNCQFSNLKKYPSSSEFDSLQIGTNYSNLIRKTLVFIGCSNRTLAYALSKIERSISTSKILLQLEMSTL